MQEARVIIGVMTNSGEPAIWETGGGYTKTGKAVIVASAEGRKKVPVYIRKRGRLANSDHALIPVKVGDVVIFADHHNEDFCIEVFKIKKISDPILSQFVVSPDTELVFLISVDKIHFFDFGQWDKRGEPSNTMMAAVNAAKEKALCYHCREPHWVRKEEDHV